MFVTDQPDARPQTLILAFLGDRLLGRGLHVATGSLLDVLARVGVSEHAARSTLTRMTTRDLLARAQRGRKAYLGLTPRSQEILEDGRRRIWRDGVVNRHWDGNWTLLSFTVPETHRAQRHLLRSRLLWAGFGPLQGGLWICPSTVDVPALLDGIEAADHVKAFRAGVLAPTDVGELIASAWDLEGIAERYRRFTERWASSSALVTSSTSSATDSSSPTMSTTTTTTAAGERDAMTRQLLLTADWLTLIRQDPHLPARHLPDGWPAAAAERLFRELHAELEGPAQEIARSVLDTIPVEASD